MAVTTSFHSGSAVSIKHNVRDDKVVSKEAHILPGGEHGSSGVGVKGRTLRDAYDDIFGAATKAYNERQKRADRRISSYYDKINAEAEKGVKSGNKSAKKLVYESIMTVGDYHNYNADFADKAEQIDADKARKILVEALSEIAKKHPHIKIVGIYWHNDEYHNEVVNGETKRLKGAPHLHVDWIPVADGYKRGLSVQNSLDKALTLDGYKTKSIKDTAQMQFQEACLGILDDKAREYGLEITHPVKEGLGEKREHQAKQDYIMQQKDKAIKESEHEILRLDKTITKSKQKVSDLKKQSDELEKTVESKSLELAQVQNNVTKMDETIEEQKHKRDKLKQEREELEKETTALKEHKSTVQALEREIENAKKAYDVAVEQKDEDVSAIVRAFTEKKKINFGKNKGLVQIFLPEGTYTRFLTMAQNIGVFERAYDAVFGLEARIQDVLSTAKNYYRKAKSALQEAKSERQRIEEIVSGDTYKRESHKLASLKNSISDIRATISRLTSDKNNLEYYVDNLKDEHAQLKDEIRDMKMEKYEHEYAQMYKEDYEDFVKDRESRNRNRYYDEWER